MAVLLSDYAAGIPAGISNGCGKSGKPASWLCMLSILRHFFGLLFGDIAFGSQLKFGNTSVVIAMDSDIQAFVGRRNLKIFTNGPELVQKKTRCTSSSISSSPISS